MVTANETQALTSGKAKASEHALYRTSFETFEASACSSVQGQRCKRAETHCWTDLLLFLFFRPKVLSAAAYAYRLQRWPLPMYCQRPPPSGTQSRPDQHGGEGRHLLRFPPLWPSRRPSRHLCLFWVPWAAQTGSQTRAASKVTGTSGFSALLRLQKRPLSLPLAQHARSSC